MLNEEAAVMVRTKVTPDTHNAALDEILDISGGKPADCMQCGKCSATCPATKRMDILPHQAVRLLQLGQAARVAKSGMIWQCVSCFACSARCPRSVDPARLIEAVRLAVARRAGGDYLKTDEVPLLADEAMPQQALVSALRKYSK